MPHWATFNMILNAAELVDGSRSFAPYSADVTNAKATKAEHSQHADEVLVGRSRLKVGSDAALAGSKLELVLRLLQKAQKRVH